MITYFGIREETNTIDYVNEKRKERKDKKKEKRKDSLQNHGFHLKSGFVGIYQEAQI